MGYIILHNRQSAESRSFVAALDEDGGHTIIEWYTDAEKVAAFLGEYPSIFPSAFPSVMVRRPDVTVAESVHPDTGETVSAYVVAAHWELVRQPADIAAVEAAIIQGEG